MKKLETTGRIFFVVALLIIFINSVFFISKKEGFFLDEKATFYLANATYTDGTDALEAFKENEYNIIKTRWYLRKKIPMIDGQRYTLDEANAMLDAQLGRKNTYFSTLLLTGEDSHPPLYYLLFCMVNSLLPGVSLIYVGFIINIIALLLTCVLMFLISGKLCRDDFCGIVCMLFYGLSYLFINNVMYIRMYALLTFWSTLLIYLYMNYVSSEYEISTRHLVSICAVECLAMLTQFYAAFMIFPLFVITVILLLKHKKSIKGYLISQIITGIIYLILWPISIFQVLFNGRSSDVRSNLLSMNFIWRLKEFCGILRFGIFSGSKIFFLMIIAIAFAFVVFSIIRINKNEKAKFFKSAEFENIIYVVVPAGFFFIIAADVSPWITARYITPAVPIICTVIILILWTSAKKLLKKDWICAGLLLAVIAVSYVHALIYDPEFAYPVTADKQQFINEHQDKEAIMIDPQHDSEYLDVVADVKHPYWTLVKDNSLEEYTDSELNPDTDYVVYINQYCDVDGIVDCFNKKGYTLKKCDYVTDFFDVYVYEK